MKFINNIPQFNEKVWIDSHPSKINDQLREAFAERVCVKCKHYTGENECFLLGYFYEAVDLKPETFSCSAWTKKEG